MDALKKLMMKGSHFELVCGLDLPNKKVVQIWPEKLYKNTAGYAVFLCEVEDEESED